MTSRIPPRPARIAGRGLARLGPRSSVRGLARLGPLALFAGAAALAAALAVAGRAAADDDLTTAAALGDVPPSPLIFPAQSLPLTFSHAKHLGRAPDLQCVDCHDKVEDSRSAVDLLTPDESACEMCHPIDRAQPDLVVAGKPPVRCAACHPGWDPKAPASQAVARVTVPTPNLKFDHAAHKASACKTCHGDLAALGVGLAAREQLPRMRICLTCHDGQQAPAACTTCHLADVEGRIRTTLPDGQLEPSGAIWGDAHDLDFRMHHKQAAETTGSYCGSCHAERFCSDCHQGVAKPMDFHAGDYLLVHAVEARRGKPDCSACHRLQSFCVGCHERSGVGARIDVNGVGTPGVGEWDASNKTGARFHPANWATPIASAGPNLHAREAQRNIQQCASCHREDFCLACHDGKNNLDNCPHPPGWRHSAQCETLAKRAGRMCLRCHITADQIGCDWSSPTKACKE